MSIWPRRARWLPFVLALLLQLVVLYVPSAPDGPGIPGFDKLVHAGVFLLPAAFGVLAGIPATWLGIALIAHAIASEVLQHLVLPLRAGDAWDAVADIVGVGLGIALGATLRRRIPSRR